MHRPSDKLVTGEAVDLINSLLQEKELRLSCNDYRQNDPPPARSPPRYLFYNIDAFGQDNRGFYVYTNDATDIKAHPFFRNINWDILHRTIPPFIPKVKGWEDTRYFDDWGNTQENGNTSNSSNMEDEVEVRPNPSQFDGQLSLNRDGGPAPDQKDNLKADVNSPARDRKKGKEKHRPRDKLLRDKRTGKTALEMRKKSAFLGYTYRRPKAVAMAFSVDRGRPYLPRGVLSELYGC
ncbi:uncharacterized protein LDX57_005552 [Aspergillus melleus]|uniref:uncharacterized protein n=1 Tax=Aspergillus melleus TaxID=138277 RepID=UPI001E8D5607|nr:uncharacterized protein LDX57_005552 [Aspergillus melleus]KAH8427847.1 hypothetical protein LDX57_005552 [Aspergillus melleus]